ncbi:MAG: hypothetical protein FWG63_09480 [Defluviitaleaceae bacterium]|nr:hypothetical protein [Defluviitaleaceae bacterium]
MKKFITTASLATGLVVLVGCNMLTQGNASSAPLLDNSAAIGNSPPTANLTEFQGVVLSSNGQGVQLEKAIIFELEGGGTFMGTGGDENEIVNVFWHEQATFELVTVTRSGDSETATRRIATVYDVDAGDTLTVSGAFENIGFVAQTIDIWRFAD